MKQFQESVLSQLQAVLEKMKMYDMKFEQLGAGSNAYNQADHKLGPNQNRTFLANPHLPACDINQSPS